MNKSILVPLTGFPSDDAALETAYLIGRLFDGHLQCLHVRPDWPELIAMSGAQFNNEGAPSDEFIAALDKQAKTSAWRANRHFAEFCRRRSVKPCEAPPAPQGVSASWRVREGNALATTILEARYHDLAVFGRAPEASMLNRAGIGEALIAAGRPIVLAPIKAPENLAPTIAISWKETAEAARAVTAAMPLLAKAAKIVVLNAPEEKSAAEALQSSDSLVVQLRWNGLEAASHAVDSMGRTAAEAVLDAAQSVGADLLVMGGYGHSRIREFVFGGFTRHVLRECRIPVFLFH